MLFIDHNDKYLLYDTLRMIESASDCDIVKKVYPDYLYGVEYTPEYEKAIQALLVKIELTGFRLSLVNVHNALRAFDLLLTDVNLFSDSIEMDNLITNTRLYKGNVNYYFSLISLCKRDMYEDGDDISLYEQIDISILNYAVRQGVKFLKDSKDNRRTSSLIMFKHTIYLLDKISSRKITPFRLARSSFNYLLETYNFLKNDLVISTSGGKFAVQEPIMYTFDSNKVYQSQLEEYHMFKKDYWGFITEQREIFSKKYNRALFRVSK